MCFVSRERSGFGRPGSDLLFRISVMQYHRRRGVSRPSSEWDRVQNPRYDHQAGKARKFTRTRRAVSATNTELGNDIFAEDTAAAQRSDCLVQRPPNRIDHYVRWLVSKRRWRKKPIERLVPVSYAPYGASTPGLSTWWSATALMGKTGLEASFPLRCVQRLSLPHVATRQCGWRHNRSTRGVSIPVLSY